MINKFKNLFAKEKKVPSGPLSADEHYLIEGLIYQSPTPTWISDDKGTLILVNPALCLLLNITEDEVIGKYNILNDNLVQEQGFMPLVKNVFEKGQTVRFELVYDSAKLQQLKLKAYSRLVLDVFIFPVRDESKRIAHAVIQHTDITQKKQMEENLNLMKLAIDNSADTIFQIAPDGTLLFVNESGCKRLGYTLEELTKMKIYDLDPDFPPEKWKAHWQDFREQKRLFFETNHRTKSGQMIPVEISATHFFFEGKEFVISFIRDITIRKNALKALKESQESYRQLVDSANSIILSWKIKDGAITFFNPYALAFFGYTQQEILGKPVSILTPAVETSGRDISALFDDMAKQPEKYANNVNENIRKDGSLAWVAWTNKIINDPQGNPVEIMAIGMDATERKLAEKALQESEERFSQVAANAGEWIWETDAAGRYVYSSPAVEAILGYKPEEMLGKYFYDTFDPKIKEEYKKEALEAFSAKKNFDHFINTNIHKNGQEVVLETSGVPLLDHLGNLTGYRGIDRDMTQTIQVEKKLKEQQEKLDLALQSANMGVWELDVKKNQRVFNNITCGILGIEYRDFKGKEDEFYGVIHPQDRDKVKAAMAKAIKDGQLYEPQYRIYWPDGSLHHVTSRGKVRYDAQGKPEKVSGVVWDITKQKKIEDALKENEKKFRSIVDNIGIGVALISPQMEVLSMNKQMKLWNPQIDLSAYPLCFRSFNQPPREGPCSYCPTVKTFQDGLVHEAVTETPMNGQIYNYRIVSSPITDDTGKVAMVIEMVENITDRRKVELELKKRMKELEIFNKAALGREERIIELKKEIESLKKKIQ